VGRLNLWIEDERCAQFTAAGRETLPDDVTEIEDRRLVSQRDRRSSRTGFSDEVIACAGKPNPLLVANFLDGTVNGELDAYQLVVGDCSGHRGCG
jgi:hypothetical protein